MIISSHDSTIPVGTHCTGIRCQEINSSALTFYLALNGGAVNAYSIHILACTFLATEYHSPKCTQDRIFRLIREPLLFTFLFFFYSKINQNK